MSTLLSDPIFHSLAYKVQKRGDLVSGFDEFLASSTVIPPGEWDPKIRIEPPDHIPSQNPRKHHGEDYRDGPDDIKKDLEKRRKDAVRISKTVIFS